MSKNITTFKSWSRVNQSGTIRQTGYGFLLPVMFYSNFVTKTGLRYSTSKIP